MAYSRVPLPVFRLSCVLGIADDAGEEGWKEPKPQPALTSEVVKVRFTPALKLSFQCAVVLACLRPLACGPLLGFGRLSD